MSKTFLGFSVDSTFGETQDMMFVENGPLGTYRACERETGLATSSSNVLPDGRVIDPSQVASHAVSGDGVKGVVPTGFSN